MKFYQKLSAKPITTVVIAPPPCRDSFLVPVRKLIWSCRKYLVYHVLILIDLQDPGSLSIQN